MTRDEQITAYLDGNLKSNELEYIRNGAVKVSIPYVLKNYKNGIFDKIYPYLNGCKNMYKKNSFGQYECFTLTEANGLFILKSRVDDKPFERTITRYPYAYVSQSEFIPVARHEAIYLYTHKFIHKLKAGTKIIVLDGIHWKYKTVNLQTREVYEYMDLVNPETWEVMYV